jgi:hypothetical protein
MPVNMDPKKRKKSAAQDDALKADPGLETGQGKKDNLDQVTERDRELAAADAELKNLWDATEVIDMDRW